MKNFTTVLKIAPAFLLASSMMHAQIKDSTTNEKAIEEVVLIGYGKQKKSDLTGSITSVGEKEFNKGAIVSADQLINGKAPGVRITNTGGSPDSAPNIRIRGGSSISAQNNPLIVIDGVPLDFVNAAGSANPLNLVNPNDIESFSILKDASATAIYGSRASNGVIIITTKKGGGKLKINFNTNVSVGEVTKFADVMNSKDFVDYVSKYFPDSKWKLGVGGSASAPTTTGTLYDTNWQDAIYRTSVSTDNNLSVSGALFDKKLPVRLSLGYNRTEGVVKTSDYERFSGALRITPTLFDKHLKIDVNAKGIVSDLNAIDQDAAIGGAISMDPTKPIYLSQTGLSGNPYNRFGGFYQNTALVSNQYNAIGQSNPLAVLLQRTAPQNIKKLLGNVELDYKMHFLPELRAVVNLGMETSESNLETVFGNNAIQTYRLVSGAATPNDYVFNPGVNYRERQNILNKTLDSYLVYEKNYSGFVSHFLIQGGYSYQSFRNEGHKDEFRYNNESGLRESFVQFPLLNPNNNYYNLTNLQSFIGRTNVDFLNKYLFTATLRADASSLFRKDIRWGYFPSVAFAWKINEENFLKDSKSVRELKLRLGWGQTGQQDITQIAGYYPSRALFQEGNAGSQYFPGIGTYSAIPFNDELTWEKATTMNAGLDFSLFKNNLITGSLDVYRTETSDLLAKVPYPSGQFLTNEFVRNVGSTENNGVELNLTINPVKTENINWSVSGNMGYNKGKVKNLDQLELIQGQDGGLPVGTGNILAYNAVGYQPFSANVYEQVYDSNGNPLAGVVVDRNNDGIINTKDKYFTAIRPNWTYGFSTSFNYKKFDFSTSLRGQIGGKVFNARKLSQGYRQSSVPQNGLSVNNANSYAAVSPFDNITDTVIYSDFFLEDASFLRMDNATVGYLIENAFKGTNIRVYASVNNAFVITKYKGVDPENFNGIDNNFYPRPRVYTVGFNLNF